ENISFGCGQMVQEKKNVGDEVRMCVPPQACAVSTSRRQIIGDATKVSGKQRDNRDESSRDVSNSVNEKQRRSPAPHIVRASISAGVERALVCFLFEQAKTLVRPEASAWRTRSHAGTGGRQGCGFATLVASIFIFERRLHRTIALVQR